MSCHIPGNGMIDYAIAMGHNILHPRDNLYSYHFHRQHLYQRKLLQYKPCCNFISFITDEDVLATVHTVYIIEGAAKDAPVQSITTDKTPLNFGIVDTDYT